MEEQKIKELMDEINDHIRHVKCGDPIQQKWYELGERHIRDIVELFFKYQDGKGGEQDEKK